MNLKISLALILLSASISAQTQLDSQAVSQRADQWLKPYVEASDFSGVLLVAQGDRVIFQKAYGKADSTHANQIATRFRIASLSKTFTAAAIELLVAQGKLSLSDPLEKYVTGIPNGYKITIEHLLAHESGVAALDAADMYRECLPNQELIKRLRNSTPMFVPGKSSQYSNEGYFLLAMVIEKISGESYERFMIKNVFTPAKLSDTGTACQSIPAGLNATGYVPAAAHHSVVPLPFNEATMSGPGSIYSNAPDLYKWIHAIDTGHTFSVAALRYPYGWGKRNYSGRPLIEQSGINEGFDSYMSIYPKEHIYTVLLGNIQSGFFNRIPKDIEGVMFGGSEPSEPPAIKPTTVDLAQLQQYAGEYKAAEIPVPQQLIVSDGQLQMHWGQYPFLRILTPVGPDEFFFRHEYAKVRFVREDGKIVKMTWQWPGGDPMTFTPVKK